MDMFQRHWCDDGGGGVWVRRHVVVCVVFGASGKLDVGVVNVDTAADATIGQTARVVAESRDK